MEVRIKDVPRVFKVGKIQISDYGKVNLNPGEMISVVTDTKRECDVTATEWGLYLGTSINARMKQEGFRVALVKNFCGKFFINAVDVDKIDLFQSYLDDQKSEVVAWIGEEVDK